MVDRSIVPTGGSSSTRVPERQEVRGKVLEGCGDLLSSKGPRWASETRIVLVSGIPAVVGLTSPYKARLAFEGQTVVS